MLQNVTTMDVLSRCERQYIRFTVGTICSALGVKNLEVWAPLGNYRILECEMYFPTIRCVEYTLVRSLPGFRAIIAGALVHMLPSLLR